MDDRYIKSVNRGLLIGSITGGLASGAGVVYFLLLFLTRSHWLVVWVPVVALALFTVGIMYLLKKDADSGAEQT
jgi:hypothetical protein